MTSQPIEKLNKEELRQTLADVIDVDATEIGEATDFVEELQVDSLLLLELVVVLEKKYQVKFTEQEMRTARTFHEALALLQRKLAVSI
ncbi:MULTISPECIES: acyl carrier protein [Streptomyces]|uniref:Acyl carrier protein n=1 Tax=Streptomyces nodosus TaxID=40318 RepID=A0A0B5DIP3_9ACTN|nr:MULTISPECIES: phosphopantetheine-binding protein [Streptomyces]AJE43583.1 Acyl carrier protein [Streptomyces nodosus]MBB4795063.1 acyl carrier protein [Streptomyces nodosus]MYV45088.1 acyl carrier protein [Streptomyces sp. SID2888]QEV42087.1 acyl carrier protein [Streptomyces nodosus]